MLMWELTPEQIIAKMNDPEWEWSFSRVNASSCLYAFYLHYIEGHEDLGNAFGQFGTVMHQTIERYLKRELDMFSVVEYYKEHYPEIVTFDFPPNKYTDIGEDRYNSGLEYFNNLNFDFDRYEVLEVEKEHKFMVGKYKFHGYIDAVYRDKSTGNIIIRDHKTTKFDYKKNGELSQSKKTQEEFDHFKKQELLYAIPVIEEYGKVDYLSWNMVLDGKIITIPFTQEDLEATKEWAINQIEMLMEERLWLPNTSKSFYCNCICGSRAVCTYRY